MNDTITPRAIKILQVLTSGEQLSRAAIAQAVGETRINTIRELGRLVELGYVATSGTGRATTYAITGKARPLAQWDVEEYLALEPDQRRARYASLQPELIEAAHGIFRPVDLEAIAAAREEFTKRRAADEATAQRELERFVIELSWKSSKIEGNTYTLLDTEQLLREAIEAPGHSHAEAVMILDHKRAFEYVWQHQGDFREFTRSQVEEVHALLTKDLSVPSGLRTSGVGITGTSYVPPASQVEIASHLDGILRAINGFEEPAEKALACLVLLPYLQPFADGNKRTSRLMANAALLAHGLPPLSYRSIDEQAYKGALILFYEQGALANFRDLFVEQLRFAASNYFL
jgi:fido (protein-threonine AMPylation protein)